MLIDLIVACLGVNESSFNFEFVLACSSGNISGVEK